MDVNKIEFFFILKNTIEQYNTVYNTVYSLDSISNHFCHLPQNVYIGFDTVSMKTKISIPYISCYKINLMLLNILNPISVLQLLRSRTVFISEAVSRR